MTLEQITVKVNIAGESQDANVSLRKVLVHYLRSKGIPVVCPENHVSDREAEIYLLYLLKNGVAVSFDAEEQQTQITEDEWEYSEPHIVDRVDFKGGTIKRYWRVFAKCTSQRWYEVICCGTGSTKEKARSACMRDIEKRAMAALASERYKDDTRRT